MLLRLQNYDLKIKYKVRKEMLLRDTLSHYAPQNGPEVVLDIAIHHVHITPEKKLEFQETIQDDPLLHSLAETIVRGWPEDVNDVPNALRPYHNHQNELTAEDGLILKGEALMIPPAEKEKMLHRKHEGHQGITKCQYRACLLAKHQPRHQMHGRIMCNMSMTPSTGTIGTTATTQTNTSTRTTMATHQC